ncbi:uncharacterized protein [Heterodontus francisci]|uniref:uncharacterized protein isoform X1 n=1 Tax=Heterodontus francisci TaxID=7792 RepID=UPI00355B854D
MLFSLRQLQEKCCEQQMSPYVAFRNLTKAFDLVSRRSLFRLLAKIGCPPKLLSIITSFHDNMKDTIQQSGASSDPFPILSGVKQVFSHLHCLGSSSHCCSHMFKCSEEGIFLHTKSDGRLFNLARLRAKTKVRNVLIRELLFADDAELTSHTEECLQRPVARIAAACNEFGLTISLKKTNIMGQDLRNAPSINIGDYTLDVVQEFTYLGSTITSNLSLDAEVNKHRGKVFAAMSRLAKRVWENGTLTRNTKVQVYQACVLSTFSTAARPGQCMSAKSDVSIHSILAASGESLASAGRTVSPTQKS